MKRNFTKQDFYAMLTPNGDCLEWNGLKSDGYGTTKVNGKMRKTHRLSLELEGIDTSEWHVLHSCDNRACCNPAHLRLGTNQENTLDKMQRERHWNKKLGPNDIYVIRQRLANGETNKKIAFDYGVNACVISRIRNGKRWGHV